MTYPKREPYYNAPRTTAEERAARRAERLKKENRKENIILSVSLAVATAEFLYAGFIGF